jgi:Asp-tRNA(Asn)/Glu-tRNA(Gln) amidotransferase C subunit
MDYGIKKDVFVMKISEKEVEQLAFLSRLDLQGEEPADWTKSLNAVLDYLELFYSRRP